MQCLKVLHQARKDFNQHFNAGAHSIASPIAFLKQNNRLIVAPSSDAESSRGRRRFDPAGGVPS
jgi:hypothetical protein